VVAQIAGALANAQAHEQTLISEKARMAAEAEKRELELLEEQRANFLSNVSHELKTPLTSLVAFADILVKNQESNLSARQLQQVQVMQRSARRLDVLISDLLDISKLDVGTFSLEMGQFDLQVLMKELVEEFTPVVQQKHQTLNVDFGNQTSSLYGDRTRITQVLTNLLSNAVKYSPEESKISLRASCEGGTVSITVKDEGVGMSGADQQNLFTPFFRSADAEIRSEAGSGLGLVIVKNIVELHGGNITFQSEKDVGTTVRVTFPSWPDGHQVDARIA